MINFHRKISKQQSFQQQRFFVSVNVEYQSHTLCHSFNSFFFFCYIYIHFISFRSIFLLTTFLNYFSPFFFSFFFLSDYRKLWKQWARHGTRITSSAMDHAKNQWPLCHSSKRMENHTANPISRNCSPANVRNASNRSLTKRSLLSMLIGIRIASAAK